jgi:ferritin
MDQLEETIQRRLRLAGFRADSFKELLPKIFRASGDAEYDFLQAHYKDGIEEMQSLLPIEPCLAPAKEDDRVVM